MNIVGRRTRHLVRPRKISTSAALTSHFRKPGAVTGRAISSTDAAVANMFAKPFRLPLPQQLHFAHAVMPERADFFYS